MNAALIFPSGTKHKHTAHYETAQNVSYFSFRVAIPRFEPPALNRLPGLFNFPAPPV